MIRPAIESDIPRVVEMGLRFREATKYSKHIAANAQQIENLTRMVMAQDGLLVSERSGFVCGMIGVVYFPHFISGELTCGEIVWWVEPEHRGEGIKLVREAERRAKERGCVSMQMIAPNEQVAAIYQRLDYEYVESTYQRKL